MPTKITTATATPVVVAAEDTDHMVSGLQFHEPLSWRAGKPIAVADLLRRLQTLFKEMRGMEQEENERNSFTTVAKELASPNLLGHKDKGVKAWTACCLVEILRLCAPDAPYTGHQLKEIFILLIRVILPALSDLSNAYNNQHLHVLESLAQVKSVVLLTDIPSSEELIQHLFTSFFDILTSSSKLPSGEQLGKSVEINMTSILEIMIDESATLSAEVIDVIIAQFLRTDPRVSNASSAKKKKNGMLPALEDKQSKLVLKDLPPAYNMARTICNACPEKMARYISQYFNDVIVDAATSTSSKNLGKNRSNRRITENLDESDDEPGGPTEEDLKELYKAHQLLKELWRASPAVLQNVIPQLEAELSAENVQLRLLATESLGDIISGIGSAGLPPQLIMDPSAYPTLGLSDSTDMGPSQNLLTKPSSPLKFSQAHPQAYSNFLRRKKDKSPLIRSAWTIEIGRILTTSAGGVGLSQNEERDLTHDLAHMMADADEKVRIAAIRVVGTFSFKDVIDKLGSVGSVTTRNSVLGTLGDRVRDRRHTVHLEAMRVLARIWGVASGEIAAGEEHVISCIGAAPSRILDAYYANDMYINVSLDRVIFEELLPMSYPPIKVKAIKTLNGNAQRLREFQLKGEIEVGSIDPDKLRAERILVLVRNLDERGKKVFFAIQSRQLVLAKVMSAYLLRCEDYNGGVMDENENQIKDHLTRLIEEFSKFLPDPAKTKADLWKFAKLHDRRSYQLIRFCMAPESDYRTVFKAMKEFTKRIETSTIAAAGLLDTLIPLLYRVGVIVYNKSHVPAIMEYSRSDEKSLAGTAHEILREISSRTPEVLKAHVQEICRTLEEEAPKSKKANDPSAIENLKACASFALRFAKEIPQDRKFIQAMTDFALFGTPSETAKYAVSIIMTTSDKTELLAKELFSKCVKRFEYGGEGFLSRLATLSQLMLLAPNEVDNESDSVIDIAIQKVLLQVRTPASQSPDSYKWAETVNAECEAKCWALKILVNRIRSHSSPETLLESAAPVYSLLLTLITQDGEVAPKKNTPPSHKSRLRLLAARLYLKLCTKKPHNALLDPASFNALALVAQDAELPVRSGFLQRLKKYLGQQRLPQRFYTIPFLLAFEPNENLKMETNTWIRSRAAMFSKVKSQPSSLAGGGKAGTVMESVFARLISLLVHHPDYSSSTEDLTDFSRYLIFYLLNVATEENLSLIYHVAQRVKQCRDAVLLSAKSETSSSVDSNLYHLSDLAQLTIRKFEDANSWNIQTLPARIRLPSSLFIELKSHDDAQRIAEFNYLPEGVEEGVEALVRASMRVGRSGGRKRKSEGDLPGEGREAKRAKGIPVRKGEGKEKKSSHKVGAGTKTPRKKLQGVDRLKTDRGEESNERRRSGRVKTTEEKSYAEREDEEDDDEMEVLSWEYVEVEPEKVEDVESDEDEHIGMNGIEEEENDMKEVEREKGMEKNYLKSKSSAREKKILSPSTPVTSAGKSKRKQTRHRAQDLGSGSRAKGRDTRARAKKKGVPEAKLEILELQNKRPDSDVDQEMSNPPDDSK